MEKLILKHVNSGNDCVQLARANMEPFLTVMKTNAVHLDELADESGNTPFDDAVLAVDTCVKAMLTISSPGEDRFPIACTTMLQRAGKTTGGTIAMHRDVLTAIRRGNFLGPALSTVLTKAPRQFRVDRRDEEVNGGHRGSWG